MAGLNVDKKEMTRRQQVESANKPIVKKLDEIIKKLDKILSSPYFTMNR